jgi:predicted nucleic acid-binding protein
MATVAYFDTSVFLQRYVEEAGSRAARAALRRFRPICSTLFSVEATSAIVRRVRSGEMSAEAGDISLGRLDRDRARLRLIDVEPSVLLRAETVLRRTVIATLDAIHIASALVLADRLGWRVPFVTADPRQRAAAERVHLEVVWVA